MASSAQQGYTSGFQDPYSFEASAGKYSQDLAGYGAAPGGFWSKLGQFFGFGNENNYEEQKLADDRAYERASIDSARAWSEYMDNTQIQRRVKDIEAAGLNPWLAVQNGGISGGSPASVDTGGSAKHKSNSGQSKTALGMLLMAIARIIG